MEQPCRKRSAPVVLKVPKLRNSVRKEHGSFAPAQTFVFMDLETTPFKPESYLERDSPRHAHDFTEQLRKICAFPPRAKGLYITEMCFLAISRGVFENGIREMKRISDSAGAEQRVDLYQRLSYSVFSSLVSPTPRFSDVQWDAYDQLRSMCPALVHDSTALRHAQPFHVEWTRARQFLEALPKPVCVVAHNGIAFDWQVLCLRLTRCPSVPEPIADSHFPPEFAFVDSLLATQELDSLYRDELAAAIRLKPEFTDESPSVDDCIEHADSVNWSVAKRRRIFRRRHIRFDAKLLRFRLDRQQSRTDHKNSLQALYQSITGKGNVAAHHALEDCQALMQVCLAYGSDFLDYCDRKMADFPF